VPIGWCRSFLSLDVPSMPLFKDDHERNILPQQPLFNLLAKFDGKTTTVRSPYKSRMFLLLLAPSSG
jgi:U4/U6.U5 tri-snRNP-associated protein 2